MHANGLAPGALDVRNAGGLFPYLDSVHRRARRRAASADRGCVERSPEIRNRCGFAGPSDRLAANSSPAAAGATSWVTKRDGLPEGTRMSKPVL
jgi:hypothetical protein